MNYIAVTRWREDDICFVLSHKAELQFHSTSLLNQQSTDTCRRAPQHIRFIVSQVFVLTF